MLAAAGRALARESPAPDRPQRRGDPPADDLPRDEVDHEGTGDEAAPCSHQAKEVRGAGRRPRLAGRAGRCFGRADLFRILRCVSRALSPHRSDDHEHPEVTLAAR